MDSVVNLIRKYWVILLVSLFGCFLAWCAFNLFYNFERSKQIGQYRDLARRDVNWLIERLNLSVEATGSISSFFQASNDVTKQEFSIFVSNILQSYPELQALEWVPIAPSADLKSFYAAARKYYPDYKIREADNNQRLVNDTKHKYY